MTDKTKIQELEKRVEQLEYLVRYLAAAIEDGHISGLREHIINIIFDNQ